MIEYSIFYQKPYLSVKIGKKPSLSWHDERFYFILQSEPLEFYSNKLIARHNGIDLWEELISYCSELWITLQMMNIY